MASPDYDFRYGCGVNKPVCRIQYSDKHKIIEAMCIHYSVLASLAELEQLRSFIHSWSLILGEKPLSYRRQEFQVTFSKTFSFLSFLQRGATRE